MNNKNQRNQFELEALEPRLLLSGDPVSGALQALAPEQGDGQIEQAIQEVLLEEDRKKEAQGRAGGERREKLWTARRRRQRRERRGEGMQARGKWPVRPGAHPHRVPFPLRTPRSSVTPCERFPAHHRRR